MNAIVCICKKKKNTKNETTNLKLMEKKEKIKLMESTI